MQLWVHLKMCGLCAQFRKAMIRIQREVKAHAEEIERGQSADSAALSNEAKIRFRQSIDPRDR